MRKTIELMFTRIKLLICISCIMIPAAASSMDKTNIAVTMMPVLIEAISSSDEPGDYKYGLAPVKKNVKWGYINIKGNEVIPCIYDDAFPFS